MSLHGSDEVRNGLKWFINIFGRGFQVYWWQRKHQNVLNLIKEMHKKEVM